MPKFPETHPLIGLLANRVGADSHSFVIKAGESVELAGVTYDSNVAIIDGIEVKALPGGSSSVSTVAPDASLATRLMHQRIDDLVMGWFVGQAYASKEV
jgi:hypothetical protein